MSTTRRSDIDSAAARFIATVDLPSPGSGLVTTITRGGLSMSMNCRLVRSLRNDSAECTGSFALRGPVDDERHEAALLADQRRGLRDGARDGDAEVALDVLRRADACGRAGCAAAAYAEAEHEAEHEAEARCSAWCSARRAPWAARPTRSARCAGPGSDLPPGFSTGSTCRASAATQASASCWAVARGGGPGADLDEHGVERLGDRDAPDEAGWLLRRGRAPGSRPGRWRGSWPGRRRTWRATWPASRRPTPRPGCCSRRR